MDMDAKRFFHGTLPLTSRIAVFALRHRAARADVLLALLDAVLVIVTLGALLLLRFRDGSVPPGFVSGYLRFLPLGILVTVGSNMAWGLYGRVWRHASVLEARHVLLAGATSGLVLVTAAASNGVHLLPLSVVVMGSALSTMLIGIVRFQPRLIGYAERGMRREGTHPETVRVAVLGAGNSAASLVRDMQRDPACGLLPIAMFDDDEALRGRRVLGVRVEGGFDALPQVARSSGVHQVVLGIASAPQDLVRRAADLVERAGLTMRIVPTVRELVDGHVGIRDIRDLRIEDLIGRQQVSTDYESVGRLLAGRRVLVTGAGGSIGSEIARQLAALGAAELLLLDHDETHLFDTVATLDRDAVQLLADIRNPRQLAQIFQRHRPEIVFHAAAHKHVPLLQTHPCEAVRTNVDGTRNVVYAALDVGVERFVFISTDKAVRPTSVMGASKRVGERIILAANGEGRACCAVRFGNVLGSRGSVVPTFIRQICDGGPVTLTDPQMTRFFMSIPEAVQLVLQAAALAEGGEIFLLNMGEPVRIYDLAARMIRLSGQSVGRDVEIRVTGPRSGEKLHEELQRPEEQAGATAHPSITRLLSTADLPRGLERALRELSTAADQADDEGVTRLLFALATAEPAMFPSAASALVRYVRDEGRLEHARSAVEATNEWDRMVVAAAAERPRQGRGARPVTLASGT